MCGLMDLLCPCLKKTEEDYDIIPEQGNYHGEHDLTGAKDGFGIYQFRNGDMYEGYWKKDKKHGFGEYRFQNGKILKGYFEDDKFIGKAPADGLNSARSNSPQPLTDKDIKSSQKPVKVNQNVLSYSFAKTVGNLKHHVAKKHKEKKEKDKADFSTVDVDERRVLVANEQYQNNMYTGQVDPQIAAQIEKQRQIRHMEKIARHRERTEIIRKKYNIPKGYTYA